MRRPHEVGAALRAAREGLGLTQAEVAAACGVSRKWLSEAEGGKSAVSLGLVLGVLNALGYEVEFVPQSEAPPWRPARGGLRRRGAVLRARAHR